MTISAAEGIHYVPYDAAMQKKSPYWEGTYEACNIPFTDFQIRYQPEQIRIVDGKRILEDQAVLRAELSYPVSLGDDARGNITRLDNAIDNFADRIADAENVLQNLEQQKQAAEIEVAKPFAQEEELAEKSARLAELNALLNIDRDRSSSQDTPEESEEAETPATRPSVLAALGEKTNQPKPVKPFRSYYDSESEEPPMTENKNRVCCLYRVSTDKQVDFNSNHEADLPMQRKACHKFAEAKGWVIVHTLRIRYTCYGKLRKQTDCTGQTGYTMHILDEIIDKMVRQIFSRLRGIPKEQLITSRYAKETAERKNHLQALQAERDKAEKDLLALKAEILAVIKGESAFPKDTLAEMIAAQEKKHTELETLCEEASAELERNAELMANVSQLYEELISYADLYDSASFEAKKMIVSQLIRRVDVYRGYQIHVDFNFDLAQYLENSDELAC